MPDFTILAYLPLQRGTGLGLFAQHERLTLGTFPQTDVTLVRFVVFRGGPGQVLDRLDPLGAEVHHEGDGQEREERPVLLKL